MSEQGTEDIQMEWMDFSAEVREQAEERHGMSIYKAAKKAQQDSKSECTHGNTRLFFAGPNFGRVCTSCWVKLTENWLPHSQLSRAEMDDALPNDVVKRERKALRQKVRKRVFEKYVRTAKQIVLDEVEIPNKSASLEEWHDAFTSSVEEHFWAIYDTYLKSKAWKSRRQKVLDHKGRNCAAQLPGCNKVATQVHHLTYRHVGREPLFDLEPVCKTCHDKLHEHEVLQD